MLGESSKGRRRFGDTRTAITQQGRAEETAAAFVALLAYGNRCIPLYSFVSRRDRGDREMARTSNDRTSSSSSPSKEKNANFMRGDSGFAGSSGDGKIGSKSNEP